MLTAGANVTAGGNPGSPSSSLVPGTSLASPTIPTIHVSHSQPEPISSAHVTSSRSTVQSLAETDVHTKVQPETKPTSGPDHGPPVRTAGANVTAGDPGPPSSSIVQGTSFSSPGIPTIHVSHSQPRPISSVHVPSSASRVQSLAKTDVHTKVQPETKSTSGPDIIDVAWAAALKIAKDKLGGSFPLELTNRTPGDNIRSVIEALKTLQKDEKKKRWSYTWRGRQVMIVERLGRILKIVEPYSKGVNTAIQANPHVAALVWAGVWAIMRVGIDLLCQLTETMLILLW